MASEQSIFSKVDLQPQDTVIVKEEPPSSLIDDHQSQTIYSETVVTKEELILDDDYLDYDEEEDDDQEEACQPSSSVKSYKCNTCQKSFPQRKMLIRHKLIHYAKNYAHFINVEMLDKDGVIQCTKCKKRYKKYKSARIHFEKHLTTNEPNFECNLCNVQIATESQYKKHMANHEKKVNKTAHLKYQCNQCNKGYETEFQHKIHLRRHENLEAGKFKCGPCSTPFPTKLALQKHEAKYHKPLVSISKDACIASPDLPLYCLKCDILFDMKEAFFAHQRQMQRKKKWVQNPVVSHSENFTSETSKPKRMEVKDGSSNSYRKHQCKMCNLRCTDKRHLKIHMKTHEKDLKVSASEDGKRNGKLTPELPIIMVKESVVVKEEPLPYEIDSTIHQEIIVKNEPVFNDVSNEDIPEPSVAEPLEQETSLSFCYETMVKEELIIE